MNISSTPFIRNDYWPDQNDINELNKRIDEVENETSLVNSRLSNDIENVSANLNSYISNQVNTTIANNIIVNSLNANYATGKFANFTNTFTNNAYVENLTVNKPVFDITLNTPHIENVTSLGGNIYDANIFNVSITGGNVAFNSVSIDDLTAENATISDVNILDGDVNLNKAIINNVSASDATILNLFVNTQLEPVTSSAVLGYDSEGRVIPIHASYDVGFPGDANYLFTDHAGTAFAGTAATAVDGTNNLITSFAVKNAIDIVNESFNSVNNVFNDIGSWQNTFENSVANSFNDVNNTFNGVNSSIASSLNNVNNSFNNVNNTFNNVNNEISNVNNTAVNANTLAGSVSSALVGSAIPYNSTSIVDYRNVEHIEFVAPARADYVSQMSIVFPTLAKGFTCSLGLYRVASDSARTITFTRSGPHANFTTSDTISLQKQILTYNGRNWALTWSTAAAYTPSISGNNLVLTGSVTIVISLNSSFLDVSKTYTNYSSISLANTPAPVYIDFNSTTNTLTYSSNVDIIDNFSRIYNEDMGHAFDGCTKFNQSITIPSTVTDMSYTFNGCTNFNRPLDIPNNVIDMGHTFMDCTKFNQHINIPSTVTSIASAFDGCTNFNQPINVPGSVADMSYAFNGCTNFNKPVNILSGVKGMYFAFYGCTKFNQPINIPSSVTNLYFAFNGCSGLNQNDIYIRATSDDVGFMNKAFSGVSRIGNIHIPASVPKAASNNMYNCLVNGFDGYPFAAANVKNDL